MNLAEQNSHMQAYIQAIQRLHQGDYAWDLADQDDQLGELGKALKRLADDLAARQQEEERLDRIAARINEGLLLEDILDSIYNEFKGVIPFNRLGVAFLMEERALVRAHWARSEAETLSLKPGYSAPLAGSSLETVLNTGQPRILNDLEEYIQHKPGSQSTALVLREGMRSSLTCPLVANGAPVGFLFFSSFQANTYADAHISSYLRIASQLSVIVEKGRLVSQLDAQKREIERQNAELLRLNELKNRFLGVAAHDLRSPLGYIQMALSMLQEPQAEQYRKHQPTLIENASRQTRRMLDLLNDLLDMTEIQAGRFKLRREWLPLDVLIAEAAGPQTALAEKKGTRIEMAKLPSRRVYADPERIRQVMDNLLSNAIKYSPPGSVVRIEARTSRREIKLIVRDQGPGVDGREKEQLFEAFNRLSNAPTGGEKATGLGLAIARWIVEAHGGQIGVDSAPGKGAAFWFTLPEVEAGGDGRVGSPGS